MHRIIDISTPLMRLNIENGTLKIESREKSQVVRVPLPDILAVIVSSPAVSLTHAVLAELAAAAIPYIATDKRFMPVGILLPFEGNALQGERFWKQREFKRGRDLWKVVIVGKIRNSARVLELWRRSPDAVFGVAKNVERDSIDADHAEAHAARLTFDSLFETGFSRRDAGHPENARLNYGYTILRSCVARFICAAGLHPTFGIHHRNRYNALALADDLMEPFRPFIDHLVMELIDGESCDAELGTQDKQHLAGGLFARWICDGQSRTLVDWIERTIRGWSQFILGNTSSPNAAPLLDKPVEFELGEGDSD